MVLLISWINLKVCLTANSGLSAEADQKILPEKEKGGLAALYSLCCLIPDCRLILSLPFTNPCTSVP